MANGAADGKIALQGFHIQAASGNCQKHAHDHVGE